LKANLDRNKQDRQYSVRIT